MKTNFILLLLGLGVSTLNHAQTKTKVGENHTKELIQTLKEGEVMSQGEWKINIKSSGLGYEFVTTNPKGGFNLYKNKKNLGRFTYEHFSDDQYWVTDTGGDEKKYYFHLKNGKKYGPYDRVSPILNYKEQKAYGYQYTKEGKKFAHFFSNKQTLGPFNSIHVRKVNQNERILTYKIENQQFLEKNGKKYGPYKSIRVPYGKKKNAPFYFTYQTEDLQWRVHIEGKKCDQTFKRGPILVFFENGKFAVTGIPFDEKEKKYYTFIDGKKYFKKYRKSELFFNSKGAILFAKNDSIFDGNKFLGKYKTKILYSKNSGGSDIPSVLLSKRNSENKKEYYIYKNGKITFVANQKDLSASKKFYLLGDDYMYIRSKDSALIVNGKETSDKGIFKIDCSNYPKEIIKYKQEGNFEAIYKNNKKMTLEDLKKANIRPTWYKLEENPYYFTKVEKKYYITPRGSNQKIEVNYRWNTFVFSKGNKNIAECNQRKKEVFINGELVSQGFGLTYNKNTDTFHWMTLEGQKVYLHHYKN